MPYLNFFLSSATPQMLTSLAYALDHCGPKNLVLGFRGRRLPGLDFPAWSAASFSGSGPLEAAAVLTLTRQLHRFHVDVVGLDYRLMNAYAYVGLVSERVALKPSKYKNVRRGKTPA